MLYLLCYIIILYYIILYYNIYYQAVGRYLDSVEPDDWATWRTTISRTTASAPTWPLVSETCAASCKHWLQAQMCIAHGSHVNS